jgi:hypothetical protein
MTIVRIALDSRAVFAASADRRGGGVMTRFATTNHHRATRPKRDFIVGLRELVGDAEGWPFLCDGDPPTCTVALVGANPATSTAFWLFWDDGRGMARRRWIDAFLEERGKFTRSREAMERFVPQVSARVIELNAYRKQSPRLAELPRAHRTTEVLKFILSAVRPRVIVCAGVHAQKGVRAVDLPWRPRLVDTRHFIYWGTEHERNLAEEVNDLCREP